MLPKLLSQMIGATGQPRMMGRCHASVVCVCVLLEYTHGLQDLPDAKESNDWGDWSAKDWEMSCLCFVGCLR